ncbi:MAG: hypothetical protein JSU85_07240 [Candidatus Zixiibacteriota bacterium]|nr:MAG: hypothetical protein JSU85_07240 [candidate division Zixibacteria bacterium]
MRAKGLAILSGSPLYGKSILGYGLAARLGEENSKTLCLELHFDQEESFNNELRQYALGDVSSGGKDLKELISASDRGFDILRLCPPENSAIDEKLLDLISKGICEFSSKYDFMIISAPYGLNPIAFLAAAMCEEAILMIDPDASAVASAYCFLKTLASEGMAGKVATIFSNVNSAGHAFSLKNKFDSLTAGFLDLKLKDGGFALSCQENDYTDSTEKSGFLRASDYAKNAHPETFRVFQNETEEVSFSGTISSYGEPDDLKMDNL